MRAEWKAVGPIRVTFGPTGGNGKVRPETKVARTAIMRNAFTRSGYRFVKWKSAANGSGSSYPNGTPYGFTDSIRLFAEWRRSST